MDSGEGDMSGGFWGEGGRGVYLRRGEGRGEDEVSLMMSFVVGFCVGLVDGVGEFFCRRRLGTWR